MKISHIRVTAARTFNHPYESFANFRFEISQEAMLEVGDDPADILLTLQEETERAAEAHKKRILSDIDRERAVKTYAEELRRLKAKQKKSDETPAEITRVEEMLAKLTAEPLMLGCKTIHAGHHDHPETDEYRS